MTEIEDKKINSFIRELKSVRPNYHNKERVFNNFYSSRKVWFSRYSFWQYSRVLFLALLLIVVSTGILSRDIDIEGDILAYDYEVGEIGEALWADSNIIEASADLLEIDLELGYDVIKS